MLANADLITEPNAQDPLQQDEAPKQDEAPSFYGERSIVPSHDSAPPVIEFQRRAIAPPIVEIKPLSVENEVIVGEDLLEKTQNQRKHSTNHQHKNLILSPVDLTREEMLLAKKAKHYFDVNWNQQTGLFDSVQGYHYSTMWDVASGIAALLSLEGLNLISNEEANKQLNVTLNTLSNITLYDDRLPNREYNTRTGEPSGRYSNTKTNGNGWSALDIGRLIIWLEILAKHKPFFKPDISAIYQYWQLDEAIFEHDLHGELKTNTKQIYRQEGRLGYLQYAAQGYQLLGYDVSTAFDPQFTLPISIEGHSLLIDNRNLPYFTTDPYVLNAIEIGERNQWWDQLDVLYALQKEKSNEEQQLWVFAEDAMNVAPWFSYNNIYYYGKPWLSIAPGGKPISNPAIFSNKIALGMAVLYPDDPFSNQLLETVINNCLPYRAIPTGTYANGAPNTTFNINTNSLVLQSLWYKYRNYTPLTVVNSVTYE
ncbi:DUF3131 domain-containing protein [Thaumasiovibrio sp. DFM-14]|uniref:DUF3131 domain-containing protein n=1 Tax=Thaumasiovibrio sp. DFM-14 TaxID=3384792 RepID=UPI0039A3EC7C